MVKHREPKSNLSATFVAAMSIAALIPLGNTAFAQTSPTLKPNPAAEKWVAEQLDAGKPADLEEKYPNANQRVLSAAFLESLLTTPGGKVHRHGVRIAGAIIAGPLDLVNAEVPYDTHLVACRFTDAVDLSDARFQGNLDFADSSFETLWAPGLQTGRSLMLSNAVFRGGASFVGAAIGGGVDAGRASFVSTTQTAQFGGIKTKGDMNLADAVFLGPSSFLFADVGMNLYAAGARFAHPGQMANFSSLKVGHAAVFRRAYFGGPASFLSAETGGNLVVDQAHFDNRATEVNFGSLSVKGDVVLTSTAFAGGATLAYAVIVGSLQAGQARFANPLMPARFGGMKVGQDVLLDKTHFAGAAEFGFAEITGNLFATEAQFAHPQNQANFGGMKVGGSAMFSQSTFAGPASFAGATFFDLFLAGPETGETSVPRVLLNHVAVKRAFLMQNLSLGELDARSMRVEGRATVKNVRIERLWNFEHATFSHLLLADVDGPTTRGGIRLDGMTYQYISGGERDEDWKNLLAWVNQSKFSASVYTDLQEFFRRQGCPDRADAVFVARKQRERDQMWNAGAWGKYLWNVFLHWSVGYGRTPLRAVLWSALFLVIGFLVFWYQENREPETGEATPALFRAFWSLWYSFDLFIPLVKLPGAKVPIPKANDRFVYVYLLYVRVHMLAGWLLVPVGVAAWTGIIK